MKFSDFVTKSAIAAELSSTDKEGVIRELIAGLVKSGALEADQQDAIVAKVLEREELGSTGCLLYTSDAADE